MVNEPYYKINESTAFGGVFVSVWVCRCGVTSVYLPMQLLYKQVPNSNINLISFG